MKDNPRTPRPRPLTLTTWITTVVAGLLVGIGAYSMSRPPKQVGPVVVFSTAADTPTPERTGFTLTP